MGEELTPKAPAQQPGGVSGGQGIGSDPKGSGAVSGAGTAAGAGAQAGAIAEPEGAKEGQQSQSQPQKVDLTQLPEFRDWQSKADREKVRLAQEAETARRQAQEAAQAAEEARRELQRLRLADADPEEVAAYYQQELERQQQEWAAQQQRAAAEEKIKAQGLALLEELGLSVETPGLDWSGGATPEGLALLAQSAAKVVAAGAAAHGQQAQQQAQQAVQQAATRALQEAGVAGVSQAVAGPAPGLREEFERKKAKLQGSGNTAEYLALRKEYRRKGLDV